MGVKDNKSRTAPKKKIHQLLSDLEELQTKTKYPW